MIIYLLFIFFTYAKLDALGYCDFGEYKDDKDNCYPCISGYHCPYGEDIFECNNNEYSEDGKSFCEPCGCKNESSCLKANIVNNKTGKVIKYAGSCEGESPCLPGFGYNKKTNQCIKCERGSYSEGGINKCKKCKKDEITIESTEAKTTLPILLPISAPTRDIISFCSDFESFSFPLY